jgi:hypothetical protein
VRSIEEAERARRQIDREDMMARQRRAKPETADEQDDVSLIITALNQVKRALDSTNDQLAQLAERFAAGAGAGEVAAAAQTNIFEDDPYSEAVATPSPPLASVIAASVTASTNPRLRTTIVEPRPPAGLYRPGSAEFRYWLAAESLARGIGFWSDLLPAGTTWSTSNPMNVRLLESQPELNAYYSRASGLRFYRQTVAGRDVYSGESPDVVCHELGHAILDAVKPQLFHVASSEAGAFHESFGDMSAMLCALQLPSMRAKVLTETSGRLNVNSRLSRVAEQLGWGIRQLSPTAVDRDSLRNAANRFFYRRPDQLPPSAPSNLLSRQVHSFSRVFTGAFLDALAWMFAATGAPDEANLLAVSRDMGQLLADGVHTARVAPAYFSEVAAAMVQADRVRFAGRYRSALTRAFMDRGILAVDSAMALENAPLPQVQPAQPAGMAAPPIGTSVLTYETVSFDDAYALGQGETPDLPLAPISIGNLNVEVHVPESEPVFEAARAAADSGASQPLESEDAARVFLEGLIQRGEIDLSPVRGEPAAHAVAASLSEQAPTRPSKFTHSLAKEGGKLVLKRNHFNCGCCEASAASAHWLCA